MKTHISLNIKNIEESISFYEKMLGIKPIKVKSNYAKFDVANPPLNLTMNQIDFENGGSLSHLGLQVESTEKVLEIGKRWVESGLKTVDEMNTDCCYALQNKIWTKDPDGNSWEVFTVLENTDEIQKEASNCCVPNNKTVSITGLKQNSCC